MDERIKRLRNALKLNQNEFGAKLGVSQQAVTLWETNKRIPAESAILMMVREFNVNEVWLRTGVGEMFQPRSPDEEIADFIGDIIKEDDFRKRLISVLARMSPEEWKILKAKLLELAEECKDLQPDK